MKREKTFESSMKRLETIISKLENGAESLESSVKLFEEGTKIANYCYGILEKAQQKVTDLSEFTKNQTIIGAESDDKWGI